ncbi:MAG: hypothetical protein BroJett031_08400 [Betaproteobacteria bacterium]|nr:MAG: hypothetical protein BroJett031_08400 [Betaproteobacteria bacterium]
MQAPKPHYIGVRALLAGAALALSLNAQADAITDWNTKVGEIITEAKLGTPPAVRVMAIVQTAAHDAVSAAQRGESREAAVAAAHRTALLKLMPAQQAAIDAAYQAALASIADGPAKTAGLAAGEKAAAAVLAARLNDGAATPESYRPHTTAGAYVPTATPAIPQWPQRKPWLMASAAQFRPGPPPALTSDAWAREFDEVKLMGARQSAKRSAEQTEIARFWEYSLPAIYFGVVRSVAAQPSRSLLQNARLYAAAAQAMDDALIAVFDAKYHYNFWRPVTAIRNGDIDGNDATARDASWAPLIDNPMHPEYPSGHSILAAAVAEVLRAEIGRGPTPVLATMSPTAKGAVRRWTSLDDFTREVNDARVFAGIHFRSATEVGMAMGRKIGELAATRYLQSPL